jgi:phosphoribosylformylglycinamidine synthase subunit PurQ / glutaminase
MTRVMVLRGFGFNCEEETEAAYKLAGASPAIVHVNDWLEQRVSLLDFALLHIPGGFSFGDELGSGQVFANRLRGGPIWRDIERFLASKGRILGICNGFQVLVRAGLLPNLSGNFSPEVSLARNAGRHRGFVDQWVRCLPAGNFAAKGTAPYELPIRHGEGRVLFANAHLQSRAEHEGLIALRYHDADRANEASGDANPNGSALGIAGLISSDGLVFGMMPHPEAYLSAYNHPAWAMRARRLGKLPEEPDGLRFFRSFLKGAAL